MSITQLIEIEGAHEQALVDHVTDWHRDQLGTAPGYQGARVLADADRPGRHVIEVHFSSQEEARENNDRPETAQWARTLQSLGTVGDGAYRNLRQIAATRGLV